MRRLLHALKKASVLFQHLKSDKTMYAKKKKLRGKEYEKELYQKVASKNKRDTSTSKQGHNIIITTTIL